MKTTDYRDEFQYVHDLWDKAIKERSLNGLMDLYAKDATFEGHAVFALFPERTEGVLRGKEEIASLFEASFRRPEWGMWWRSGNYCTNESSLVWEYPRLTPAEPQLDLVEFMDIEDGLIRQHRVYWGWQSIKAFIASSGI